MQKYIKLANKIICITGGTGYVGRNLIDALIKNQCKIRILTRNKNIDYYSGVEIFNGDLTDASLQLESFLDGCDIIFNCAAELKNTKKMHATHVIGIQKIISTIKNISAINRKKIHFIQLSSCGVYGQPSLIDLHVLRSITEETILKPKNEYEITKSLSDKIIMEESINGEFFYTILRPSNIIGKNMVNQSIRKLFSIINSGFFFFIGKKDSIAPYVHIQDVVNALLLISICEKSRNEIFNLSNDCTWKELILEISSMLHVSILPIRIPLFLFQFHIFLLH